MAIITTAKVFGTGQITLPKKWRDQVQTKHVVIEETPEGLLVRPITDSYYYEMDEETFGIKFPLGIRADKLLEKLEEADGQIS